MALEPVARETDTISHGGNLLTPSQTIVQADDLYVACIDDPAHCDIHGSVTISSGSSINSISGKAVARVTDSISCGATITTGSDIVSAA